MIQTKLIEARLLCVLVLAFLLSSIIIPIIGTADAAALPGFNDVRIAAGLDLPTAMEFAPDGRLFISEKDGNLRVIKNGVLLSQPFATLSVNAEGERGLLGIAFDPNFASNGYLYVYYTTSSEPVHNRISRLTADPANPDRMLAGSEVRILDLEPLSTESHNGGALEFGPDGRLYVSTGDNYFPYYSQSLTSRFGKILRINPDGTIPSDNPFYNVQGAYREIWALGLRNPFTFQFSGDGSKMYIADVGQYGWEEINPGLRGANYGWPTCEGACSNPNFIDPVYSYPHPTDGTGASITGGPFYDAAQFPSAYRGSYFFGDYVQGFISRLTPTNQVEPFLTDIHTPVAIQVGPDGSLYYLSIFPGEVHRVTYGTPGNSFPTAGANASPSSGQPPLAVSFSGSASSDPDGDPLTYSWNFGDGSPAASGVSVNHTYQTAGSFEATLTVNDGRGGSDTDTLTITVGTPPVGTIDTPVAGTAYDAGDTITFSGSATDTKDGTLPASAFEWRILFHHNTHTHPFQEYHGVTSGAFTIPTVGETDHNVWYRIYLTVTDSDGLTHTTTRDVLPNKSSITLASNVSGLQILLDGQPYSMPYTFTGVVGMTRTLEAPSSQNLGGTIYNFESWSDGGNRIHTISTPAQDSAYSATFQDSGVAPERTLTVHGVDLYGNPLSMYTTIALDGTIIQTGFTPLSFTGTEGVTYTVVVQDYGSATFDHWENGNIVRARDVTLHINTELTAFYRTSDAPPPSSYNLSVRSADVSGNPIAGYYTVISESGSTAQTGYTPLTYIGTPGQTYAVTVSDYGNARFSHWEDGSTERTRTVTLSTSIIITAYFDLEPPAPALLVSSADLSGSPITGYYTVIEGGGTVGTGFTPLQFTGVDGATYTVQVQDYGDYFFDHWEDGSRQRDRQVTLDADTAVTAYYRTHSLVVQSADISGNPLTGYYAVISSAGSVVQTGFTPLVFQGQLGTTYQMQVQDYGNFVFDHWEDGSIERTRTVSFDSDTILTAYYVDISAPSDGVVTIKAASLDGQQQLHMWTVVQQGTSAVQSGFTPMRLQLDPATSYSVTVSDYQNLVFDHWEDGSTERTRVFTPSTGITMTAYYAT